jgi:maltooligosyltrehalose trehalohydrolase
MHLDEQERQVGAGFDSNAKEVVSKAAYDKSMPHELLRTTSAVVRRRHTMRFGTEVTHTGTQFKLWAPKHKTIRLKIKGRRQLYELEALGDGWHRIEISDVGAGARYKFVLTDGTEIPDPASRYQPDDVHGFSEVIDPLSFAWTDREWRGRPWEQTIIYELHIGTFTQEGTFLAAIERLDYLVDLGITAIQIMPLGDFPGEFNWGYDGAMWFAPDASYGRPEDLKAFIDAAHSRSLMVFLDVVYNHFGPEGNYLPSIAPIFSKRHVSPWGEAINYDGEGASVVREFAIESALYWVTEFNVDGLRFDAVHAIADSSPTHILEIMAARVRSAKPQYHTHLIVENSDNQESWLKRNSGLIPVHYTAQWNDDVHHLLHSAVTGENTGYYADFDNLDERSDKLGRALAEGFAYQGEMKPHEGMKRGEPSVGLPPTSFVAYMQNHDQIGNRVKGDRILKLASADAIKALASVYLLLPQIPMLFMGEEYASDRPFPFFSDVHPKRRAAIREGRKEELKRTPEYEDPTKPDIDEMVDPVSLETFHSAKLDWAALRQSPGRDWLNFYRNLIDLRKAEIIPRLYRIEGFSSQYEILGARAVHVQWWLGEGTSLHLYANLAEDAQAGVELSGGRRIWQQGFVENNKLGPWTVLWILDVNARFS